MNQALALSHSELHAVLFRARDEIDAATACADILAPKLQAQRVYDEGGRAARLAKAKGAHDDLVVSAYRLKAHALEIEAQAARKLADEYDGAQERGEIASGSVRSDIVPSGNDVRPATAAEAGISRKEVFEARRLRDAEQTNPGIVKRALDGMLERGEEPTRAALRREIAPPLHDDDDFAERAENFVQGVADNARAMIAEMVAEAEPELGESKHVNRTTFTGNNEWFTPQEHVERARRVLGEIDLDPASHVIAQSRVQAKAFFTEKDDGLTKDWAGRIWLNPPYAQPAIGHFVDKIVEEVGSGRVEQAIMLTHNYTDTAWFQKAARAASSLCFTRGRIRFVSPTGEVAAPTQGQTFFYFGPDADRFHAVFSEIGFVVEVLG